MLSVYKFQANGAADTFWGVAGVPMIQELLVFKAPDP
jgi:hypothetical protein